MTLRMLGSLGLELGQKSDEVVVTTVSIAMEGSKVEVGMAVRSVQGMPAVGKDLAYINNIVQRLPRPLTIVFSHAVRKPDSVSALERELELDLMRISSHASEEGETISVTLQTEDGDEVEVDVSPADPVVPAVMAALSLPGEAVLL